MIEQESYKSRAVEVRRSARAHVLEIRRARIARRKESIALQTNETSDQGLIDADVSEGRLAVDDPPGTAVQRIDEQAETLDAPEIFQSDASLADDLDDVAVKNAAMAELIEPPDEESSQMAESASDSGTKDAAQGVDETALADQGHSETRIEAIKEAPENLEPAADDQETQIVADLDKLPGAGPGLIWMLNQCEIFTLADLAAQKADDLSPKLGVVGQILDVERWIRFALDAGENEKTSGENIT